MRPASSIGIFFDIPTGNIKYIMNPDYEEEIDLHVLGENEAVFKVPKDFYGISFKSNTMTIADCARITSNTTITPLS
jgi:hypothetical protein